MPIKVICDACGQSYSVLDEAAGSDVKCQCGHRFSIPAAPAPVKRQRAARTLKQAADLAKQKQEPKKKRPAKKDFDALAGMVEVNDSASNGQGILADAPPLPPSSPASMVPPLPPLPTQAASPAAASSSAPAVYTAPREGHSEQRYRSLREVADQLTFAARVVRVAAWLTALFVFLMVMAFGDTERINAGTGFVLFVLTCFFLLLAHLVALLLNALADYLRVVIDTEENTRLTEQNTRRIEVNTRR